ncbi:MAG TPA: hypothetical protein VJJ23_00975 [Candidatus Nanoarchaeia archaeon]|nr:hypothetical protein [Candidatus Nanoarchaeia archaeon]
MILEILKILLVLHIFIFAVFRLIAYVYDEFFNRELISLREKGYDVETGWKIKKHKDQNG